MNDRAKQCLADECACVCVGANVHVSICSCVGDPGGHCVMWGVKARSPGD